MTERRVKIDPADLPEESLEGSSYLLPEDAAHYLRDVLRLEPGDEIELFDGTGRLLQGTIQSTREDVVRVGIFDDELHLINESPREVVLCQSIPKGKRWRWVLEKGTEMGVQKIVPLESRHTVVRVPESKLDNKLERWRRILGEAARQCERSRTPQIVAPRTLSEVLDSNFDGRDVVLHARADAPPLPSVLERISDAIDDTSPIRIWIGPEGGFSDEEVEKFEREGVDFARLGSRILRTETAAVVTAAIVQEHLGDLNEPG